MVDYKLGQYPEKERDRRVCDNILDVFRNKGNSKDVPVTESSDSEEELPKPREPIQSTQTTMGSEEKQQDDTQNSELSVSKESELKPEESKPDEAQEDEVDEVTKSEDPNENLPTPEESGVNFDQRTTPSDEEKGRSLVPESPKSVVSEDEVDEVDNQENLPEPVKEVPNSIEPTPISDGDEVDEVTKEVPRKGGMPQDPRSVPQEPENTVAQQPKDAISEGDSDVDEVTKPSLFATTAIQGGNENTPKNDAVEPHTDAGENLPVQTSDSESESESESEPERVHEPDTVIRSNDPVGFNPEEVGVAPAPKSENAGKKPMETKSIQDTTQQVVVPELQKKEETIKKMQSIKRRCGFIA